MFTRKLSVVGRAAAIIVLGIFFVIVLRTDAGTVGIAVGTYLVEDVFELEAVVMFSNAPMRAVWLYWSSTLRRR